MTTNDMLHRALCDLSDTELDVLTRRWGAQSRLAALMEAPHPMRRVGAVWYALAVLAAEESERRADLLDALDDDGDGEIVADPARAIADAEAEWRRAG